MEYDMVQIEACGLYIMQYASPMPLKLIQLRANFPLAFATQHGVSILAVKF